MSNPIIFGLSNYLTSLLGIMAAQHNFFPSSEFLCCIDTTLLRPAGRGNPKGTFLRGGAPTHPSPHFLVEFWKAPMAFVRVPHLAFSFFHSVGSSSIWTPFSGKADPATPATSLKYFSTWASAPAADRGKQAHLGRVLANHWFWLVRGKAQMTSSWSKAHPAPTGSGWGELPVGSRNRPTAFWPGLGRSSGSSHVRKRPSYSIAGEGIWIIKLSSVIPALDRCIFVIVEYK